MAETCANPSRGHYIQGCRCPGCTKANREYNRKTGLYGFKSSFVDAEPVRRHIEELLSKGYTLKEICRVSGVSKSTMRAITHKHNRTGKPVKKVNAAAAEKIMAVNSQRKLGTKQLVNGRYVRQGLDRCRRAGMSVAAVARITGISRSTLDGLIHFRRATITGATLYKWIINEPALNKQVRKLEAKGN